MNFNTLFLYLFLYSVVGWICEVLFCRIVHGKWTNRGFLSGPYCPIYGFGALLILFFLNRFRQNPFLVFGLSILLTTTLEYITSFAMEKIFNAKWWDYSDEPLNINGRVCAGTAMFFGIGGLFLIYFVHPYVTKFLYIIPSFLVDYLVGGLVSLVLLDIITTLSTLINLKDKLAEAKVLAEKISETGKNKAANSELINQLEDVKNAVISKTNIFHKRIINAFPQLNFKKYQSQFNELKATLTRNKNKKDNIKTNNNN